MIALENIKIICIRYHPNLQTYFLSFSSDIAIILQKDDTEHLFSIFLPVMHDIFSTNISKINAAFFPIISIALNGLVKNLKLFLNNLTV